MTVEEIASWLNGEVVGDKTREITRVAKIEDAGAGELTFLANPKYEKFLSTTHASVVLVSRELDVSSSKANGSLSLIRVDDPYVAFLQVLNRLTPQIDPFPEGIHASTIVAPTAKIGKNVALGANVVIDEGAVVGDHTKISHACIIGKGAQVGSGCILYPRVTVYHQCKVGNRTIIHAGTVIGSDGFGFAPQADGSFKKIPQIGNVKIEDDVEIGANSTIDRATIGSTIIKSGAKLDNLIQVGHNTEIGNSTVIAAQAGISGSTKIGSGVMIGGQAGIVGHIQLGDGARVNAQSGVSKSIGPGKAVTGSPAYDYTSALRSQAVTRKLPDLEKRVKELEAIIRQLLSERTML